MIAKSIRALDTLKKGQTTVNLVLCRVNITLSQRWSLCTYLVTYNHKLYSRECMATPVLSLTITLSKHRSHFSAHLLAYRTHKAVSLQAPAYITFSFSTHVTLVSPAESVLDYHCVQSYFIHLISSPVITPRGRVSLVFLQWIHLGCIEPYWDIH